MAFKARYLLNGNKRYIHIGKRIYTYTVGR